MSFYELMSLIVWTISSLAVIVSLYWVNRQTSLFAKQTEYVARSFAESLSESMNNQSHEISRLFVEYPELRPYFYDAQTIEENHPDYHRAEAVAEQFALIFLSNCPRKGSFVLFAPRITSFWPFLAQKELANRGKSRRILAFFPIPTNRTLPNGI